MSKVLWKSSGDPICLFWARAQHFLFQDEYESPAFADPDFKEVCKNGTRAAVLKIILF